MQLLRSIGLIVLIGVHAHALLNNEPSFKQLRASFACLNLSKNRLSQVAVHIGNMAV
jgi:hypothetical protein